MKKISKNSYGEAVVKLVESGREMTPTEMSGLLGIGKKHLYSVLGSLRKKGYEYHMKGTKYGNRFSGGAVEGIIIDVMKKANDARTHFNESKSRYTMPHLAAQFRVIDEIFIKQPDLVQDATIFVEELLGRMLTAKKTLRVQGKK